MKRRNFLQALGFTAVAKPSPAHIHSLNLDMIGVAEGTGGSLGMATSAGSNTSWIRKALVKLAIGDQRAEKLRKQRFYMHNLDANVAGLRSVSLQHKLSMSRDVLYERAKRQRKSYLEARLAGILDDDD